MAHEVANIKWIPSTRVGLWRGLAERINQKTRGGDLEGIII